MGAYNPYPNREHGVGVFSYAPKEANHASISLGSSLAQMEFGECELIYDLPRLGGGGDIANLGHARGGSAVLMARGLQDRNLEGQVYSVDLFKVGSVGYTEAVEGMEFLGLGQVVIPLRGSTDYWGQIYASKDSRFSLVFIDADHSYEGVKADFSLWGPMIFEGGLVAFHDTNQEFSNCVLRERLIDNPHWVERKELHVNRIRVFERRS